MANKRLSATITIGGAVSGAFKRAITSTKSSLDSVGKTVRNLGREQKLLSKSIQEFGRLGKNVDGLRSRYAAVTRELERQTATLGRLKRLEESREANLARRSAARSRLGTSLALGAAVVFPSVGAFKKASEFNYNMQVIGNTADMTKEQIDALGQEVRRVAEQTLQTSETVQGAIGFLVAAGMDVGTATAMMLSVGRTATATASDIEDVSRAAFTLNDTLNISPAGMQGALDMLVQAGKEGNFEFKAMAENLPVLGASFKALKMEGGQAVATLGAALQIARKGAGDEAEAANNLRNFLAKVLAPDTLKKASAKGVDLYGTIVRAQKEGRNPFEAAIAAINHMTKGGDQKLLGELFQDMQVQNFLRPMLQNIDEYKRIRDAALSSSGVVDRDFVTMAETSKMQAEGLAVSFGNLAKVVGDSLEPAFGRLAGVLRPAIQWLTDFASQNKELTGTVALTTGALTALGVGINAIAFLGTFAVGGFLRFAGAATKLAPALRLVGSALLFVGRAALLNPIGLTITVIAGAALLIYKYWEPIKAFMIDLWGTIKDAAQKTWAWMTDVFFSYSPLGVVIKNWDPIKGYFTGLWDNIKSTAAGALDWIIGKINTVGSLWTKTKGFFGFGDDPAPAAGSDGNRPDFVPSQSIPDPVPVPPMAGSRGNKTEINDARQYNFTIAPQPGQSPQEIADAVMRELRAREAVERRSGMYDPAMGY